MKNVRTVVYSVAAPYSNGIIEVYGDPENAWYEFRLIEAGGRVLYDTASESSAGRGYGNAAIALRDALMRESGLHDPGARAKVVTHDQ